MNLFSSLQQVKSFKFNASAGINSATNWNGIGHGKVVTRIEDNQIFFKEEGSFSLENITKPTNIFNEYIWTKLSEDKLRLSHARFGYKNTVTLFDLIKISETIWQSEEAHVCVDDLYSAELEITSNAIKLKWNIAGPKKDETIEYNYSF